MWGYDMQQRSQTRDSAVHGMQCICLNKSLSSIIDNWPLSFTPSSGPHFDKVWFFLGGGGGFCVWSGQLLHIEQGRRTGEMTLDTLLVYDCTSLHLTCCYMWNKSDRKPIKQWLKKQTLRVTNILCLLEIPGVWRILTAALWCLQII